ncbi:MAG: response regulator [Gemmatimonadetes bacterium]|nr:response regulator [Gemmatimonadota bacterium]
MDILIVDDDEGVRKSFSRALERAGYMVMAVDNGLAAFAELQRHHYRAIVCDIHMPFLEGRTLFDELRKDYPQMAQRVVFATGWGEHDEVGPFLRNSGRPVLHKPVDLKELVATVRGVAEQRV